MVAIGAPVYLELDTQNFPHKICIDMIVRLSELEGSDGGMETAGHLIQLVVLQGRTGQHYALVVASDPLSSEAIHAQLDVLPAMGVRERHSSGETTQSCC